MPVVRLTDRKVRSLKTKKEREEFWDASFSGGGFVVRVFASGEKRYMFLYRNLHGERKRFTIGNAALISLTKARQKAMELAVRVGKGEDPAQDRRDHGQAETVAELCHEYLELHAKPNKKASSLREDERIINCDLLPRWGNYKAVDVRRKDVIALLDDIRIKRKAPVQANRTRALIHRVFNFGLHREIVFANPCAGLPRMAKEKSRDRVLTESEICLLFKTLDLSEDPAMASVLKLILLTGQRPGEVKGMRWSEIDENVWTIPKERAKNGTNHKVFLCNTVLDILSEMRQHNSERKTLSRKSHKDKKYFDDFVFPSRIGGAITWLNHRTRQIVEAMEVPSWTPHDLRRTMSTYLENDGVSADVIDQIQNHKKQGVKAIYQRGDRWKEVVDSMKRWERMVEGITGEKSSGKVIPLKRA